MVPNVAGTLAERAVSSPHATAQIEARSGETTSYAALWDRVTVLCHALRMRGYLGEAWPAERWLHTGDLGVRSSDGRVRVVDRLKDLILRGGHNVVPAEVESALVALPQIAAAALVGVPDARLGEAVVAVIVVRDEQSAELGAIHVALHERLADWQRPARYAVVDALPHGGSGKVLRRALRTALVAGELLARAP